MNVRKMILRANAAGVRLYPKEFREAFSTQMLLTVEDTLHDARTRRQLLQISIRLAGDLVRAVLTEHGRRLTASSARSVALFVLQLIGVAAVGYVCIMNTLPAMVAMRHELELMSPAGFWRIHYVWYVWLIISLMLVLMVSIAFISLRRAAGLSLWGRLVRACGIGFGVWACSYAVMSGLFVIAQNFRLLWLGYAYSRIGLVLMLGLCILLPRIVRRMVPAVRNDAA